MAESEKIKKFLESLDEDEICNYCKHYPDCDGSIKNYGNGPIFPPCADGDVDSYIDYDLVDGAISESEEEINHDI